MSGLLFFVLAAAVVWFVVLETRAGRTSRNLRALNVTTLGLTGAHLALVIAQELA